MHSVPLRQDFAVCNVFQEKLMPLFKHIQEINFCCISGSRRCFSLQCCCLFIYFTSYLIASSMLFLLSTCMSHIPEIPSCESHKQTELSWCSTDCTVSLSSRICFSSRLWYFWCVMHHIHRLIPYLQYILSSQSGHLSVFLL